jgi:hypothetical protein
MHLCPWNYLRLHQDEDPGLCYGIFMADMRHRTHPIYHRGVSPTPHLDTHSKELLLMQADTEIEQNGGARSSSK